MHMYIDTNQDTICFTISLPIVDVIIKELFYRDDDQILAGIDETATSICHAKDRLKVQKLSGINDHNVSQYVHVLVATNLNKIANKLLHLSVWAFLVVGDGNTHHSSSFFDMHICICVNDVLSNLHLVAIPMFKRHTVENIFNMIARFLDALSGATMIWHAKLMFVSTNGENRMIRCHRGVVTRLEQATEFPVLRI
ncbi:unnamed protein product [Sphagnum troendelagicum]|uniref:Uncharacterized protein n=1 Tax=Sphagnum jensenii TaxID=128206 RepID=A0ABP0VXK0_9BRYO